MHMVNAIMFFLDAEQSKEKKNYTVAKNIAGVIDTFLSNKELLFYPEISIRSRKVMIKFNHFIFCGV